MLTDSLTRNIGQHIQCDFDSLKQAGAASSSETTAPSSSSETATSLPLPEGEFQLVELKQTYREQLKGKRLTLTDGNFKDVGATFLSWSGTVCYLNIDGVGRKSIRIERKVRIGANESSPQQP